MAATSHKPDQSEHDTVDININVESPLPFPSFSQAAEAAQSPVSDSSGALTSSDKLSALPQTITSQNLNRTGRSPKLQSSPRVFRSSIEGSKSWPHLASDPGWNTFNTPGRASRASMSDGSIERGGRGRASLDSDRGSMSGLNTVKRAFRRMSRTSDPTAPSPAVPPSTNLPEYRRDGGDSHSNHSRSRAVSPIRMLQQWGANISRSYVLSQQDREEPFVPIDPFHFNIRLVPSFLSSLFARQQRRDDAHHRPSRPFSPDLEAQVASGPARHGLPAYSQPFGLSDRQLRSTYVFLTDWLPRVVYLHLLLRLPSMYFSRVARIFEDAEVSRPDIQRMVEGCFGGANAYKDNADGRDTRGTTGRAGDADDPPQVTPALRRFKYTWEDFIDSLLREWKTLNVVSALLLSAILTMFQVPNAASDPVTRTAALLSLICAIMALSYGCMFIVRFGSMRSMFRASRWAEEARKTKTSMLWNVWVLLAMPAVWMSWSMIFFIVSILSFVWRTGAVDDPDEFEGLSPRAILGPRIAITAVFLLGLVYFFAILRTLQSYGQGEPLERRKGSRFYDQRRRAREPYVAPPPAGNDRERRGRDSERGSRKSRRRSNLDVEGPTTRGRRDSIRKGPDDDEDEKVDVPTPKGTTAGLGLTGVANLGAGMSVIDNDTEEKEKDRENPVGN
ncbi:hypothetical protein AAF712_009585 [Marasmius tenuissimus]|uniref:Uncharacterized protein n=1 Tax=Marasmius tenuissimus TaxID=585030 RepID=A0ABR2ZPJ0_9AGAR